MATTPTESDSSTSSSTELLTSFARNLRLEDCPDEAVEMAKECIIDVVGVTLAGADEVSSNKVKEYVHGLGATGETTVMGESEQYALPHAALINGVQGHALDYDDTTFYTFSLHPSVTLVPTLLATGEITDASGRDILASFIAGFETQIRIAGGIGGVLQQMGYHPTGTVGVFGATVAAGRLLDLNQGEFQTAMGIASSLYSGLIHNYGTMTKPYHAGLANQNGIKAAMLAKQGLSANSTILDESSGPWLNVEEEYKIDEWCEDLGEEYYTEKGIGIKKYPSCACTHGGIDAACQIRHQLQSDLNPETIESITIYAAQSARDQLKYDFPETPMEAKFSMPYCVSSALLDGDVNLDNFDEKAISRPDIRSLLEKSTFESNEQYANEGYINEGYSAKVSVEMADGTVAEKSIFEPSGTPSTPITKPDLEEKFHECATQELDDSTVDELYDELTRIETVENVNTITKMLREQ